MKAGGGDGSYKISDADVEPACHPRVDSAEAPLQSEELRQIKRRAKPWQLCLFDVQPRSVLARERMDPCRACNVDQSSGCVGVGSPRRPREVYSAAKLDASTPFIAQPKSRLLVVMARIERILLS